MELISVSELKPLSEYYTNSITLIIVHICPLDGQLNQSNCKRSVITREHQNVKTNNSDNETKYLVVLLYGSYAKTPFKKSELKVGQTFSLKRFQTHLMPLYKSFKCDNGHIISNFYETLVLVKSEYEPIIKMIVNSSDNVVETENSNLNEHQLNVNNMNNDNIMTITTKTNGNNNNAQSSSHLSAQTLMNECDRNSFTYNKTHESRVKSTHVLRNKHQETSETNKTKLNNYHISANNKSGENNELNAQTNQKDNYMKIDQILKLHPSNKRIYANVYGVVIKKDQNKSYIYLADETVNSFEIKLVPGKTGVRRYPPFRTGDVIRIHRLLLAPNSNKKCICMDPKDLVVFESFKDCKHLSKGFASASEYAIEEYDKTRKLELEQWFSNQLLEEPLSGLKRFGYVNIAVQLIKIQTTQNWSVLNIWDGTHPTLRTFNQFRNVDLTQHSYKYEQLITSINHNNMSLIITVFDEHSIDVAKLKPSDIIIIFNAHIKNDRRNVGYSYIALNSTYKFGKCIRLVDNNSYLGKILLTRIKQYKVNSAVTTIENQVLSD